MKFTGDYTEDCICTELIKMQYKTWDEWSWYGDAELLLKGPIFLLSVKILPATVYFIIKTAALGIHLSYLPVNK